MEKENSLLMVCQFSNTSGSSFSLTCRSAKSFVFLFFYLVVQEENWSEKSQIAYIAFRKWESSEVVLYLILPVLGNKYCNLN